MHAVGVREAKARLSELLRDARRGREWVITEHGAPIAKLVPIHGSELPLEDRLHRLEEAGVIEPPHRPARSIPPPLPLEPGLAQQWLQEDRRS